LSTFRRFAARWGAYFIFPILVVVAPALQSASEPVLGIVGVLFGVALLIAWTLYRVRDERNGSRPG
jgi:hypothetical protein